MNCPAWRPDQDLSWVARPVLRHAHLARIFAALQRCDVGDLLDRDETQRSIAHQANVLTPVASEDAWPKVRLVVHNGQPTPAPSNSRKLYGPVDSLAWAHDRNGAWGDTRSQEPR